ncbi:hypothetical protein D3C73_946260 [compost metagenome]
MTSSETFNELKARKLADLRAALALTISEPDKDVRIWRQGVIHGRLMELESFGVLMPLESFEFALEVQRALDAQLPAANDPITHNDPLE